MQMLKLCIHIICMCLVGNDASNMWEILFRREYASGVTIVWQGSVWKVIVNNQNSFVSKPQDCVKCLIIEDETTIIANKWDLHFHAFACSIQEIWIWISTLVTDTNQPIWSIVSQCSISLTIVNLAWTLSHKWILLQNVFVLQSKFDGTENKEQRNTGKDKELGSSHIRKKAKRIIRFIFNVF